MVLQGVVAKGIGSVYFFIGVGCRNALINQLVVN
jgi:hypothetical protein